MVTQRPSGKNDGESERTYAPECYACPIGTISMALQKSAPETTEHLTRAGRELLLAMRGVIDGLAEFLTVIEERKGAAERQAPIESIPIRRRS